MRHPLFWTLILGLTLSMSAAAQGNSGNAHGNGHGKGNPHNRDRDDDHDRDHDRDRWESRGGWEYGRFEGDHRPPGWSKGKKTGWGNCNLPPGQAKKYGCNTYSYGGRRYYWYKDDVGRIVVRRPVISVHGGVDIH